MKGSGRSGCKVIAGVIAIGLTGCSSFQREWEKAGAPAGSAGLEGRWEGRWESARNHHHGGLRCIVTRQTNDTFAARFHAKYKRLFNFSFGYTAVLETNSGPHPFNFRGAADLGWLAGGEYGYEGYATATNFVSTYTNKYDHGSFYMNRPPDG